MARMGRFRTILILAVLAVAAGAAGVFSLPPTDRDESRFAQATVQMLETGDFVRISFQEQPRHKKPVGIHWLQAASVGLFSEPEARAIWAYRLPSLLGAALAVLSAYWAGCVLLGRRAAVVGASLLSVTLLLGYEAGIAKTDAMLVGLTTLSMAALAAMYEGRRRWVGLVFWIGIAGGVMIKGPITPLVVGLTIVALFVIDRRARWMRPILWWPGPIVAALMVGPWLYLVQQATDGAFLAEALGKDLGPKLVSGHETHGAPPGAHLLALPITFWPATLFLLPGLAMALQALRRPFDDHEAGGLRFLLAWAVPAWIVFELVPTKLPNYTLPLFPALALMAGAAVVAIAERRGPVLFSFLSFVLFGAVTTVLAGLGAFAFANMGPLGDITRLDEILDRYALSGVDWTVAAPFAAVFAAGVLIPLILWRAPRIVAFGAVALGLVWQYAALQYVAPRLDQLWLSQRLSAELEALTLHPRLSPLAKPPLAVTGFSEPSLVFLTRTDTVFGEPETVANVAAEEPGRAALVESSRRDAFEAALEALGARAVLVGQVSGLNYSKGDPVTILIFRITQQTESRDARLLPAGAPVRNG
jgi:4-amino-4-deoxy-L-arabinose transferase-like glycosyltransferase